LPPGNKYTLNHYSKSLVEKSFSDNLMNQVADALGQRMTHIWQLVPDIFSLDMDPPLDPLHVIPAFNPVRPRYLWQQEGYWHIARAQIHCKQYGTEEYYYNDLANNLRTGHMDVTFQPTFLAIPYRDIANPLGQAVHGGPQRTVFNFIGREAESNKRSWHNSLRLERGFDGGGGGVDAGAPSLGSGTGYDELRPQRGGDEDSKWTKRVKFVRIEEGGFERPLSQQVPVPVASQPPGFSFDEDIGMMEDAGPLMGSSSGAAPPTGGTIDMQSAAPPAFSVPKPGLKSAKRPPARGKGVVGAVLAADGSVTHEPSRML
jgi:hypothetical protein